MYQIDYRKRFAQVAVVALLTCSAVARADNCAGGADATGNDCSGAQAVPGLSDAESHLLHLRGQAAIAELRAARAKQRLIDAAAALNAADAAVKLEEAELKTARMALQASEKKQQGLLAVEAR
jgi:hypothetical protein